MPDLAEASSESFKILAEHAIGGVTASQSMHYARLNRWPLLCNGTENQSAYYRAVALVPENPATSYALVHAKRSGWNGNG
jgi:hypothetical protein